MTSKVRKKRRPKSKALRFALVIEAQKMIVSYTPDSFGGYDQFEFRSPHEPPRRIPVSETGYLCDFADKDDVKAAGGPKAYARALVLAALAPRRPLRVDEANQLSLFT